METYKSIYPTREDAIQIVTSLGYEWIHQHYSIRLFKTHSTEDYTKIKMAFSEYHHYAVYRSGGQTCICVGTE